MSNSLTSFLKASKWTFLSVVIKSISGLLFNKLIAIYLGPTGITLQAHVMNLFNAVLAIPQEGSNKAIIKYLSPAGKPQASSYQYLFGGIVINLVTFLLFAVYLLLNQDAFFRLFAFDDSALTWGCVFLLCMLAYIFNTFFLSFLQLIQNFKTYAILNTLGNLFGLIAIALFITQKSYWTLLALPLGLGCAILPTTIFAWPVIRQFLRPVKWSFAASHTHIRDMSGFVLMALSVLLFSYITSFAMREYSIQYFEVDKTGLWQAVSTLSGYYMAAFSAVVISVYYPQVAAKIDQPKAVSEYIKSISLFLIPVIIIGLLSVYWLRSWLLDVLFTTNFAEASSLFDYQLLGDFFRMLSFLLAALLLAQGKTSVFIILQAISAIIYIVAIPLTVDTLALESFLFAHFLRNVIYFMLLLVICRQVLFRNHE